MSNDLGCTREFSNRAEVTLLCEVRQGAQPWQIARLADISQAGFHIAWLPECKKDAPLRIRIPGLAVLTAQIRWQRGNAVGCEFAEPLHIAVFEHIVQT
ncbi:MAG: PilZ domain-containing protein, partial [Sphingomonadales bacterium]|nr:PilZ domain-containing protein [Sphingomonadales bacterium]